MSKQGMPTADHRTFGLMIEQSRLNLMGILVGPLQAGYTKSSREMKAAAKAIAALDSLKCVMDSAACREKHPDATRLYYGRSDEARKT